MDFSHDKPPKPNTDSSSDEGRSHFLETLGAGEDTLNSLRQLREITAENSDDVVLSSQPDDISDTVSGSALPSRSVQIQVLPKRVQAVSETDSAKVESSQPEAAPLSKLEPKTDDVDFGVGVKTFEKEDEAESLIDALTDLPLSSDMLRDKEAVVAGTPEPSGPTEEEAQAEMDARFEMETQFEMEAQAEREAQFELEDSAAAEALSAEKEGDEISSQAPMALVQADSAPNEQVTLACPKCEGELTLMRQHLGVEGNCVWCQLPIVAAASGANGLVRIFPLQPITAVFGSPASELPVIEEVEEVAAELAKPEKLETESVSVEGEEAKTEEIFESDLEAKSEEEAPEEVQIDEVTSEEVESVEVMAGVISEEVVEEPISEEVGDVTPDEITSSEVVPDSDFEERSAEIAVEEVVSESEKTENEEMPVTFDSFQAPEQVASTSFFAPTGDLPQLDSLPTGFQDPLPISPAVDESQDELPSGFASPMITPASVPDSEENVTTPFDSRDEQNDAPTELDLDTAAFPEFEGLPVPMTEEVVVPSGFTPVLSPMEVEDVPVSEEPSEVSAPAADLGLTVKNEAVASGFSSPMPWGDFPTMPTNDTEAVPSSVETISDPTQGLSGFVERIDDAEAAVMSGFAPVTDLDDAPTVLSPLSPSGESRGLSGFDVPEGVSAGGDFGNLEMSEPESIPGLPSPEIESKPDVEFGSPVPSDSASPELEKEGVFEKGFGSSLMNLTEESPIDSPFGNSPFAALSNPETEEVVEEATSEPIEEAEVEKKLLPPISEAAPVNKIPEPEGPRVESSTLKPISPTKKSRKGGVVFMVILVGFVCGGALATFVLPVEEYVEVAKSYMEAKFGVDGAMPSNLIDLPSIISPGAEPIATNGN